MNRLQSHALQFMSLFGTPFFYLPAALIFIKADFRFSILLLVSLASTEAICAAIKLLFPKERPVPRKRPRKTIYAVYDAGSFPSAHTARIVALSSAIIITHPNPMLIVACALLVTGVAYSRLQLKQHHTTDVLAGAAIGAAMGLLAGGIYNGLI